jgi:acyl carrier protein
MAPEDIVCKVFVVQRAQVDDETSNRVVPEWDSMGHVNLILELETTYGVSFSAAEALQMTDVASIKQVLQSHGVAWE